MPTLKDTATYVRSKAAGPFWVTIDIFCGSPEAFDRIRKASALAPAEVGALYGAPANQVKVFEIAPLNVIKISFPRVRVQGSARDSDSHAGQYFVPLLGAAIP